MFEGRAIQFDRHREPIEIEARVHEVVPAQPARLEGNFVFLPVHHRLSVAQGGLEVIVHVLGGSGGGNDVLHLRATGTTEHIKQIANQIDGLCPKYQSACTPLYPALAQSIKQLNTALAQNQTCN